MGIQNITLDEFRTLFEIAQDVAHVGYWEWDIQTNEVLWSRQKIEIYGEVSDSFEPTFEKFLTVIDEQTKARVFKEIDQVLSGKKRFYDLQHQISLKSGKTAWVHEKAFVIYSETKEPVKMVGIVYDITDKMLMLKELKNAEEESSFVLSHDLLTGLLNKDILVNDIKDYIDSNISCELFFLNIKNFKIINNSFGHIFGDVVLRKVAELLKNELSCSRVYRYSADEFVILTDTRKRTAQEVIEKLKNLFERPFMIQGNQLSIAINTGVSRFPEDAQTAKDLIKNANSALSLAKNTQSNVLFYEGYMSDQIAQKYQMLSALRKSIEKEDFIVYYQPQVDARTETIVGFEALVRWRNEDGDIIPPGLFLPVAQEYGIINQIDFIVMKKAISQLGTWIELGYDIDVSINSNLSDFEDKSVFAFLKANPTYLNHVTIEITEAEIMACSDEDLKQIEVLKSFGMKVSLDDFGTGYSSLRYIHRLHIDELKIDKEFVDNVPGNNQDEDLVQVIKNIVDIYKLDCVVEGVEQKEQQEFFIGLGLPIIQGYLYSKPLNVSDATQLLQRGF